MPTRVHHGSDFQVQIARLDIEYDDMQGYVSDPTTTSSRPQANKESLRFTRPYKQSKSKTYTSRVRFHRLSVLGVASVQSSSKSGLDGGEANSVVDA